MRDRRRSRQPALPAARMRAWRGLGLLIPACAVLCATTGCQSLSYPEPAPAEAESEAALPDATTVETADWAALSRAGRDAVRMHDLPLAETRYAEALEASNAFPAHDARLDSSLGNLLSVAASYQTERRFEDADRVIGIVIEARERGRGPDFATAGLVLAVQGEYLESTGADHEAIRIYETALALPNDPGSPNSATRQQVQHLLGKAFLREGLYDQAEPHVVAVLEALEISPGPEALATATAWLDVAKLRDGLQEYAAAEAAYLEGVRILEKVQPGSIELALGQNGLAWFYLERGRNREALAPAESANRILTELDVGGGVRAAVLDTLATAEMRTQRLGAAEEHYKQAIAAREQADPEARRALVTILENYAELLRGTDRAAEAARIEAQIADESKS